ncbi:MAG: hypothetical protein GY882_09885, partial [Actinomycetia bacterium]|nr:hypothetical protein [Actinomycetes bacterium]
VEAEVDGTCRTHGERVSPRFEYLRKGGGIGCRGCRLGRTTVEALAELAEWAPNLAVDPDWTYYGSGTKVNGTCRVHGERVSPSFSSLQQGGRIGCRGCCPRGRQLGRTTVEALAELAEWAPNLDVDPDWDYAGVRAEVDGTCNVHGERVSPRFRNVQQGKGIGCRGCRLGRTSDESLTETARGRLAK